MKINPYCQRRNCSPLNVLFSGVWIMLISQGIPPLGASNKGGVGKTSYFRAKCVNISKKEIRPKLLLMTIRNLHMRFRLTQRSITLDDLELL